LHPDKPGGDKDAFAKLQEAYETLSDEDARAFYDATGGKKEAEKTPRDRAIEIITEDVRLILDNLTEDKLNRGVHLIDTLKQDLDALRAQMKQAKGEGEKRLKVAKRVLDEVIGEVFEGVAKSSVDTITVALEKIEFDLSAVDQAFEIIKDYEHNQTLPPWLEGTTSRTTSGVTFIESA